MNITGIVAEYNPLHKGHEYHIKCSKDITESDGIVGIMSGNFVQRGMPAIIDKWNRTKAALLSGVDLVVELPTLYAISSAEFFAFGSISLLNNLGGINNVCFGSELGDINALISIASMLNLESPEFKEKIMHYLNQGLSYPSARSNTLEELLGKNYTCDLNKILNNSNNILGIEYCKSLLKLNSKIAPFCIKRKGSDYNSEELTPAFASATAIRKYLKSNENTNLLQEYLPMNCYNILNKLYKENYNFVFEEDMLPFIKYKFFTTNSKFEHLPDVTEGLHNKIRKSLEQYNNISDVILDVKSKRYTYSRISRILCQYFIGFETLNTSYLRTLQCPYARVLGFNDTGKQILKHLKKCTSIPIYTKLPKEINEFMSLDIKATKAYSIINKNVNPADDFLNSPIIM